MKPARWFYNRVLDGVKELQARVSYPFLHYDYKEQKLYEAIFVAPSIKGGRILLPTSYFLMDTTTGAITHIRCKEDEIPNPESKESFRYTYFVPSEADISEMCVRLDETVQIYEETTDDSYMERYERYKKLLETYVDSESLTFYNVLTLLPPSRGTTVEWKPSDDLTTMDVNLLRHTLYIAKYIIFLPCPEEDRIKFAYPIHCSNADRLLGQEKWVSLKQVIVKPDVAYGHFKAKKNGSLYTKCKSSSDCLYDTCPYVAAAYVKYLAENNPEELIRQVHKVVGRRGILKSKIGKVKDIYLLLDMLSICDVCPTITFEVEKDTVAVGITDFTRNTAKTVRVFMAELESEMLPDGCILDEEGYPLSEYIRYLLYINL